MAVLLLLLVLAVCASAQQVTLQTKKGPILGLSVPANVTTTDVTYNAFIGIPYGKVPARFQLAVPPDSWSEPLKTQSDGPVCPQPGVSFDEQCLYINVFTPKDSYRIPGVLPVMVFIHGSAFTHGSSTSHSYGPDFLVKANVTLVTMNYRMGAAGFLTLGSKVAPGNLGLHDTLLALQWVHDEIAAFGGDPSRVTLFGQSAGGVMTSFHYLSPLSTGLFIRAIAQSGSALSSWGLVTVDEGSRRARLLADRLGCNTKLSDSDILACLQKADIKDIVGNQTISLPTRNIANGNLLPFVPVLDSWRTADQPFFNDSLARLMEAAVTRAKPLISGFTTDEGILIFSLESYKIAEANLEAFVPESSQSSTQVNTVREQYFPSTVDDNKVQDLVRLSTDYSFAYPAVQMSRYFANITYGYVFAYDGTWAPTPSFFARYRQRGVCHGDDLTYLFYGHGSQSLDTCATNLDNIQIKDSMVMWWTNFAKTGVPDDSWKNISTSGYKLIDSTSYLINNTAFESRYFNFWDKINQHSTSSSSSNLAYFIHLFIYLIIISTAKALVF